jgi:hypothetical protein
VPPEFAPPPPPPPAHLDPYWDNHILGYMPPGWVSPPVPPPKPPAKPAKTTAVVGKRQIFAALSKTEWEQLGSEVKTGGAKGASTHCSIRAGTQPSNHYILLCEQIREPFLERHIQ